MIAALSYSVSDLVSNSVTSFDVTAAGETLSLVSDSVKDEHVTAPDLSNDYSNVHVSHYRHSITLSPPLSHSLILLLKTHSL